MEEKEIWKDIEGYEGMYQVSNMGNVKSLNYNNTGKEGILKPWKNKDGYLQVQLYQDRKRKMYLVHQLVATAFCENPMGFTVVNHKDENKQNNCMENLEWCSVLYNNTYNGRAKKIGKKVAEKLSKPVIAIDKRTGLIVEFLSIQEASRQTAISQGHICECCQGKRKSIGGFYWYYADTTE